MIPLYTYPGATWDQTISTKAAHPLVPIAAIVNPSNGPGYSKDSNYEAGIQNLKEAGVIVLGYVSTAYTSRDLNAVKSDIDAWKSWYPDVQGIFLDEQTNWSGPEWYYDQADEYAKAKGFAMTVGNPGANSIPSYLDTVDVVLIYESPGLPDLGNYQDWSSYPNNKLGMIPFNVDSMPAQWVQDASSIVGWIYVTDDRLPNPWDSLPAYFEELVTAVEGSPTNGEEPPSPRHSLTIKSVDQNIDDIDGMWIEVEKNGVTIHTGFTPMTLSLESSSTYAVAASNYEQIIFDHWSDGTGSSTISLVMTEDTTITAHYQTGAIASTAAHTLTIQSVDQNGNSINGLWTEITDDGSLETGFTPVLHTTQANSVHIAVADYENYLFDHWQDTASTSRERDIAIEQDTGLYAVYNDTTLPDVPPDPPADDPTPANTFTLTQESTSYVRRSSENLARGTYTTQVEISGNYNFDGDKLTFDNDSLAGVLVLTDSDGNEMSADLNIQKFMIYKHRYIIYKAELEDSNSGYVYGKLRFTNLEDGEEKESRNGSMKAKIDGTKLNNRKITGSIEFK